MTSLGDRYLRVLCILLLGYALMGKGFAYIGIAPLYVGELTMVWGVVVLFCSENWSRVLRTAWFWPLFALMIWGAIRTVPFLATYGTDALHDAAMWIWGTFAVVLASLLAAEPRRLAFLEKKFRTFAVLVLILAPISYCISIFADAYLPNAPWADVPFVLVKGGDLVVHLCGIFAFFVLLGGPQMGFVVPMMIVHLVLYFTGRASMVTFGSCSAIATALRPQSALPWRLFPALVIGVTLLWVFNIQIQTTIHDPGRIVSAEQIIDNVQSIFSDSDNENLDGSREWRLLWWNTIADYTLHGNYFWKGKGFGINLADDDGFQVEADHSLRNPHNGHLTMLARGGVPMLVLWVVCQSTLGYGLIGSAWSARRRGDRRWFGLLAFLFIYWLAFLINASFDVFLEGPVGGIWFWCVYGTGIGAVWIYRNCPQALREAPIAGAEELAAERMAGGGQALHVQRKTRALELCAS